MPVMDGYVTNPVSGPFPTRFQNVTISLNGGGIQ
jgi:hypothetical protein